LIYQFFSDSGHGWLSVQKDELISLGIDKMISNYSFVQGNTVYLEEDQDLNIFLNAKEKQNPDFKLSVQESYTENSGIRNFQRY